MKVITWRQLRHRWKLYLLILPSLAMVLTFAYFPATSAIYHSFFRWDGDEVEEFVGLDNFRRAFADETLGWAFVLVMILIFSNLFKMIPSIITAVMIHRMSSERARYVYRVLFVIPMIIPAMVWLLVWKYFYDPTVGVLNGILNATGLMGALAWLDHAMPWLARQFAPVANAVGGAWAPLVLGVAVLVFLVRRRHGPLGAFYYGLRAAPFFLGLWLALYYQYRHAYITLAVAAPVTAAASYLVDRARGEAGLERAARWVGSLSVVTGALLVLLTQIWPTPTGAFAMGTPAWLGQEKLIIPALIFWGFPWVGVVSVLLYLSGLGNIDQSIYDAAEIDGCGWFRKFWNVELPLILTQVRLNLILMVIGTLQAWGLIFILLGDTGGPNGVAMVPGLYMFRKAFREMEAGYACAIGLILFFVILILTIINNRYVRVEK